MIDHDHSRTMSLVPTQEEMISFNLAVTHWLSCGYTEMSACMLALARWAPMASGVRSAALRYVLANTNQRAEDLL
jgi:hypothetical protein